MGHAVGTFSGRSNHELQLNTQLESQSVEGNYSVINWQLYIVRVSGTGSYKLDASGSSAVDVGANHWDGGGYTYDTRSATSVLLGVGTVRVYHNSAGAGAYNYTASTSSGGTLGNASVAGTEGLPTIARASTPSFGAFTTGVAGTINTNRASSGFTHTLICNFGAASITIATGVGSSFAWAPSPTLLAQIPNSTSGVGSITTNTYSGGTYIGTSSVPFSLYAGADIVPTLSTITAVEGVPAVASLIGALVQGASKLSINASGAAGAYGSTIARYAITAAGYYIGGSSGITGVLPSAGSVLVTATVTDSRGRTASKNMNVTVLPYAPPSIDLGKFRLQRSDAVGNPLELGDRIRVYLMANVQSLVVGSEKNALSFDIKTRERLTSTWIDKGTTTPGGTGFDSASSGTAPVVIATYDVESSWEVIVIINDVLSSAGLSQPTSVRGTTATAVVAMDQTRSGTGIQKFWEQGALDVGGQIFQNNGEMVWSDPRLGPVCRTITDWNDALDNGWYMGVGAANAPTLDWCRGVSNAHNAIWRTQTVEAFTTADTPRYRRQEKNGVWGAWVQVFETGLEIDARIAAAKGVPYAAAAGTIPPQTVLAGQYTNVTVTLPVGRFSQPPIITANSISTFRGVVADIYSVSATSFVLGLGETVGQDRTNVGAGWHAIQMTPSASAG